MWTCQTHGSPELARRRDGGVSREESIGEDHSMHVQIVTFGLEGISEDEYHQGCKEATGIFAQLPVALTQPGLTIT